MRRNLLAAAVLLALAVVVPAASYAQCIEIKQATAASIGINQSRYCVRWTADQVGSNYSILIEIKDQFNVTIAQTTVNITNGAGHVSACFDGVAGGVTAVITLTDLPGSPPGEMQVCQGSHTVTLTAPGISPAGLAAMFLVMGGAAILILRRRRAVSSDSIA